MKYFYFLLIVFYAATSAAQTTTYEFDYTNDNLGTSCNIFSSGPTVDAFVHKTVKGSTKYNPSVAAIQLECARTTTTYDKATEFQIIFPFKKDYKYQITAQVQAYTSTNWGIQGTPMLSFKLNLSEKASKTSTSCIAPENVNVGEYDSYTVTPASFSFFTTPPINTPPLTQNFASLSIAATPNPGPNSIGTIGVYVQKIIITEFAPYVPPPNIFNMASDYFLFNTDDSIDVKWNQAAIASSTVKLQVYDFGELKAEFPGVPNNGLFRHPLFLLARGTHSITFDPNLPRAQFHNNYTSHINWVPDVWIKLISEANPAASFDSKTFAITVD